jgi:hypothetical protein
MMNEWSKGAFGQLQCRESDGQVKTPWPGAPRIKIEHTVNSLDPGPMRVAGNDHVNSAGYGIQLEFIDIVEDVDRTPAEPYHLGVGITFRPVAGIDIPSDRNHRRNLAESGDDVRPTDVAGVDDMCHPRKALLGLWT